MEGLIMKRIVLVSSLALCTPLMVAAAEGFVGADISLQAGPDAEYPSIVELAAGTPVQIEGCIDGYTWCDVVTGDQRGWIPGAFLEQIYGDQPVIIVDYGPRIGIPVVSFSVGIYWDRYYHNRPFYAQREQWISRHIVSRPPPRPQRLAATQPTGSAAAHAHAVPPGPGKPEPKPPVKTGNKPVVAHEAEAQHVAPEAQPPKQPVQAPKSEPKATEESKPKPRDELKPVPRKEDDKDGGNGGG
jgi:uncharacterized protein YraI